MPRRLLPAVLTPLIAFGVMIVPVAATGLPSTPAVAPSAPETKAAQYRMILNFDQRGSTLRSGTKVRDASGRRHPATVVTQAGGRLVKVKGVRHRGADFPNHCQGCGRTILEVRDQAGLDPLSRPFSFGAAIRVPAAQVQHGANIIQKGFFKESGGQYKLQLDAGGVPTCVLNGSGGRFKVSAPRSVANGHWHRVACARTLTGIQIRVDGTVRATQEGVVGRIANAAPIRSGGKKVNPANKQFHGRMDSVFVRVLSVS